MLRFTLTFLVPTALFRFVERLRFGASVSKLMVRRPSERRGELAADWEPKTRLETGAQRVRSDWNDGPVG